MMNNTEIIKGIDLVIEGLTTIKNAFTVEVTPTMKAVPTEVEETVESKPVETKEEATVGNFTVEQLNSMKYNEFKKLASSLGVKCTGTRDEIMERILSLNNTPVAEEVVEEETVEEVAVEVVEESKPTKSDNAPRGKRLSKKEVDEPTEDEFDRQAEEIAKDTPVEDIIEALADIDIKATKKNYVTLLAEALRNGLLELDDEEEEEDVFPTTEETEDIEEEISADSYFPEYDPKGFNNPENMTEERLEAIEAKMDEILTAYAEEELTDEDVASYVEDNATEAEIELLGDDYTAEDILKLYMELVKRTIDNDGEEHEQGEPYEVADKDVCCGHELKYVKKTKKYICEHCGTEYEAE